MNFIVKQFDTLQAYEPIWQAMQDFVAHRTETTPDEIWLLEHEPVFTLGQSAKWEHVLNPGNIPVVPSDRGGQVTYHGPGQLMGYCLFDINRLKLNTRELVCLLERSIIEYLATLGITAYGDRNAPGVYVDGAKIASLGLRIRQGYSYHGICLNVSGSLDAFNQINPCGIADQKMTNLEKLGVTKSVMQVGEEWIEKIKNI